MKIFYNFLIKSFIPLTKIAIGIIIIAIFLITIHQIVFGKSFEQSVIDTALYEAGNRANYGGYNSPTCKLSDYSKCIIDSAKEGGNSQNTTDKEVCCKDSVASVQNYYLFREDSLLDILSKSNGLLNSNTLTFCVTLIVALLASLLLLRIDKMDKLIAKNKELESSNNNLKSEVEKAKTDLVSEVEKAKTDLVSDVENFKNQLQNQRKRHSKFTYVLTWLESSFNMTIIICNMAQSLLHSNTNKENTDNKEISDEISEDIGNLSSSLRSFLSEIESSLNNSETKLEFLTTNEKALLKNYLDDSTNYLKRSLDSIKKTEYEELNTIIDTIINQIKYIRDIIDSIVVKDDNSKKNEASNTQTKAD